MGNEKIGVHTFLLKSGFKKNYGITFIPLFPTLNYSVFVKKKGGKE